MCKQDIIDGIVQNLKTLDAERCSSQAESQHLIEMFRPLLKRTQIGLGGMVDYQPGDKALIQGLIRDMASNSDTTGVKRVLLRLVSEMDD